MVFCGETMRWVGRECLNAAVYVSYLRTHACIFFENRNGEKLVFPYLLVCFVQLRQVLVFPSASLPRRTLLQKTLSFLSLHLGTNSALSQIGRHELRHTDHSLSQIQESTKRVCVRERELSCPLNVRARLRSNTLFPPSFLSLSPVSREKNVL